MNLSARINPSFSVHTILVRGLTYRLLSGYEWKIYKQKKKNENKHTKYIEYIMRYGTEDRK